MNERLETPSGVFARRPALRLAPAFLLASLAVATELGIGVQVRER